MVSLNVFTKGCMRKRIENESKPVTIPVLKYTLVRKSDGLIKIGDSIQSISFNENGLFKGSVKNNILLNHSLLILNTLSDKYWQTTLVKEITSESDSEIHFRTENSEYLLKIEL